MALTYKQAIAEAAAVYTDRQEARQEVWRRSGVKGQVFHLHAKAERAFSATIQGRRPDPDDLRDMINYAAFALILLEESDMNGSWPWNEE